MAELTDFLPYVRRHISGPLNIMMTDALSMSAVAFCRQSLLCRREATLSPSAGEDCVLPYDAENEECVHIIRILADGRELFAGHDVEIRPGRVMHFACSPGEVSVLYAVLRKQGAVRCRMNCGHGLKKWQQGRLNGCSCRPGFHGQTRRAHSISLCCFLRVSVGHIATHWRQVRTPHTAILSADKGFTDDDDYRNHRTCEYTTG